MRGIGTDEVVVSRSVASASKMDLLDFLYLDLPRLTSFASQLFEGLPSSKTHEKGHEAEFGGDVEGGIPFVLKGGANTRALFSAASSVTSTVHHELVNRVIAQLRSEDLLTDLEAASDLDDGAFAIVTGRLQIVDPTGMTTLMRSLVPMQRAIASFTPPEGSTVTEKRRAARGQQQTFDTDKKKFDSVAQVTESLGRDNVRVRILRGSVSVATAIAERDKFIESLDRLVLRHGYLTGGPWTILAQANVGGGSDFYQTEGENLMDLLEKGGVEALQMMAAVTTSSDENVTLTPLAIYRTIPRSR